MAGKYFVKLEHFEGPLDLLLHLIKVHELNIFNIDLLVLTTQYLNHLRLMRFRDLKEAAVFMEMAATLIEIKSRSLLPQEEEQGAEDQDIEDEEDPAVLLQKRLLEYEGIKKAAEFLSQSSSSGVLTRSSLSWKKHEEKFSNVEAPLRGDRATLLILYEQMLTTLAERRPVTVSAVKESITVDDVIERLKDHVTRAFFIMFQKLYAKMSSRYEFVAYILAVLQLVRDRELKIYQEELMGPLWVYSNDIDEARFLEEPELKNRHRPPEDRVHERSQEL